MRRNFDRLSKILALPKLRLGLSCVSTKLPSKVSKKLDHLVVIVEKPLI